jgi:orotate phosphoribosyltransferase
MVKGGIATSQPSRPLPEAKFENRASLGRGMMLASASREYMENRALLRKCLQKHSVVYGDVTLSSGKKSHYYIDCKRTTLNPEGAFLTGNTILDLLNKEKIFPEAIGGPTVGADPIVTSVAVISHIRKEPLHAFFIRKDRKTHGLLKQVEGLELKRGMKVVIVDEVCTTGDSTLEAVAAAEREGFEILAVLSLVDREEGGSERIKERKYPYFPVFTAKELLEDVDETSGTDHEAPENTGAKIAVNRRSA